MIDHVKCCRLIWFNPILSCYTAMWSNPKPNVAQCNLHSNVCQPITKWYSPMWNPLLKFYLMMSIKRFVLHIRCYPCNMGHVTSVSNETFSTLIITRNTLYFHTSQCDCFIFSDVTSGLTSGWIGHIPYVTYGMWNIFYSILSHCYRNGEPALMR